MQVQGHDKVFAIADEDLEREDETKTSSVHFLRFELAPEMAAGMKGGADLAVGIDHPNYQFAVTVDEATRGSLAEDLG